jgi:methylmalonyl-CoA mutase N-terminal domain/subunit
MVGVNRYQSQEKKRTLDTLYIDRTVEQKQIEKLNALKARRNAKSVAEGLSRVKSDAETGKNLMPAIVAAVKEYATLQEICDTLRSVYGEYREEGKF